MIVVGVKDDTKVVSQSIISWFMVSAAIIYVEHFNI